MPPEAKVLVVEDNWEVQKTYGHELSYGGHEVVAIITDIAEASVEIHALKQSGTRIDVAIVDGNLGGPNFNGEDGAAVVGMLREVYPGTKIIGNSLYDEVKGADVNLPKSTMTFSGLIQAVTEI